MRFRLEYDNHVVGFVQRAVSLAFAFVTALSLVSVAQAQISSTGIPVGARAVGGAPPTHFAAAPPTGAVSPRTGAVAPPTAGFVQSGVSQSHWNNTHPHSPGVGHTGNGNHPNHTANGTAYYPFIYPVPVPYAVDVSATDDAGNQGPADDSAEGFAQDDPPTRDRFDDPPEQTAALDPEPEPPQPPTTLVFKDGHQIEVSNYAIVSETLYDLTPGHARKVALSDLDLAATEKQNDDRGVVFQLPGQLPPGTQAN
jgi:hypothetical protein